MTCLERVGWEQGRAGPHRWTKILAPRFRASRWGLGQLEAPGHFGSCEHFCFFVWYEAYMPVVFVRFVQRHRLGEDALLYQPSAAAFHSPPSGARTLISACLPAPAPVNLQRPIPTPQPLPEGAGDPAWPIRVSETPGLGSWFRGRHETQDWPISTLPSLLSMVSSRRGKALKVGQGVLISSLC